MYHTGHTIKNTLDQIQDIVLILVEIVEAPM